MLAYRRGVWHLHPTTLNEAVDASGKRDLISPVYLQTSSWVAIMRSWIGLSRQSKAAHK